MTARPWKTGDIAECTASGQWVADWPGENRCGPLPQDRMRVERVVHCCRPGASRAMIALGFSRWPGKLFPADDFVAVTPRHDPLKPGTANWLPLLLNLSSRHKGRR